MDAETNLKYDLNYEEIASPKPVDSRLYLEDSCRAILCGCFSCQMRARKNLLKWGIPIPTKKEAREILGLSSKTPVKFKAYSQILDILEKMKFE